MANISTLTVGSTKYDIKDNIANGGHFGGTGSTTKIKININSTTSWMLSFVVTLYQGYRATKVMISGYQYGSNYWYEPEAVILGDSNYTETITVYFGYDAATKLWVGFDGGNYTGITITDVVNGYTQIPDYTNLFTISNVSSLATIQKTVTAESRANYANSAGSVAWDNVTGKPSSFTPASHSHSYLPLSGGTLTGDLGFKGSTDDSPDIVWYYSSGQEKMRIWTSNTYTSNSGPNYRIYKSDGTALYSGTLALADHTHSYLPLSGGTLTGNLITSGAGERYVQATNTNTGHSIYLDSSSSVAGIWSNKKNGWALQVDTSGNVALNGNATSATTASGLSSTLPTLAVATESNEITVKDLGNNAPANSQAHRHGIDFKWYNTHWLIGNLRSGSTDSHGFGISYSADGTTYTNTFKISPTGNITATSFNGYTIAKSVPSDAKFTDTNTWRGIQDNLTSSTNTTESLSAKQGYLLANGSARDSTKLPLSGGTLTGTLSGTAFARSGDSFILAPNGGYYSANSATGAMKIILPVYKTSTMLIIHVDIYNYIDDETCTYTIGGYNYTDGLWYSTCAYCVGTGSKSNLKVRFGSQDNKNCIWIGETNTSWSYPKITIRDITTGHSGNTIANWASGWSITPVTSFGTVNREIATTNRSDWANITNKPSTYSPASHGHGVNTANGYSSITATAACATALNTTNVYNSISTTAACATALNTTSVNSTTGTDVAASKATVSGSKLVFTDVTASKVTTTATTVATSIKTTANAVTALGTTAVATSIKSTANAITGLGTTTFATSVKNS